MNRILCIPEILAFLCVVLPGGTATVDANRACSVDADVALALALALRRRPPPLRDHCRVMV